MNTSVSFLYGLPMALGHRGMQLCITELASNNGMPRNHRAFHLMNRRRGPDAQS